MADSWRDRQSRQARQGQTLKSMARGTVGGRVAQAARVPAPSRINQEPEDRFPFVGPDEPEEAPTGKIWFDTDEPV